MVPQSAQSLLLLLHIWWPLLMGWSLVMVVHRATGRAWDPAGLAVLLTGIVAAYSLDRVLDAPPALTVRLRRVLIGAVAGATLSGAVLVPSLPLTTAVLVPVLGVLAAGYVVVKRVPLGKAVLVPLVWTWAAIALPFGDGSWFGWRALGEPIAAPVFLLMAAGCLLCDLKDVARDRAQGVPSVPVLLGPAATIALAVTLAATGGAVAFAEGRMGVTVSALALSGIAALPALLATDVIGPLLVDVILTVPGLLIAARLV